jgi:hypothetical protein
VEGIAYPELFAEFLAGCRERGYELVPLSALLQATGHGQLPSYVLEEQPLKGRDGKVATLVVGGSQD